MPAKLTQDQQSELRALVRDSLTFAVRATLLLVNKSAIKPHNDYVSAVDDVLGTCNRLADQLAAWGVRDTNPSVVAKLWAGGSYSDGGPGGSPYDVTPPVYPQAPENPATGRFGALPGQFSAPDTGEVSPQAPGSYIDPDTGEVLQAPGSVPAGPGPAPVGNTVAREELLDALSSLATVLEAYPDPVSMGLRRLVDAFTQFHDPDGGV